jgi:hypothetical protein
MLYVFVTVPVVSFVLLRIAFRRKGGQRLAAVSMFIVFVVFTAILFTRFTDIRNASRWLTYARVYKAEVLSGSEPGGGQLRHAELEGWGFPGAGDTVVYVVFDPMESLAAPSKTRASGRFTGLPCDIFRIQRLENSWYAVQFYTGTDWDNWADCDNLTKTPFR